jgi:hypothetical protein
MSSRPRHACRPTAPHSHRRTPHPSRRRPDRAVVLTAVVRSQRCPGPLPCRLAAHPSPSCRATVPTPVSRPFPRPSPMRRWGAAVGSPCSAASTRCATVPVVRASSRRAPRAARAGRAGPHARRRPRPSRAVPAWPWAAHAGRASAVSTGHAPRGSGPCAHVATGRARVVRLGRAWFRPSGTRFRFYIF